MGYCHRPSGLDLLTENRDYAAVASQHISKTHCSVFGTGDLGEDLHHHLADPLGGPHHIGRPYRFVRGDQDHLLHMVLICGACHIISALYIVFDRLVRAVLHQRYMLMRRRVIHNVRMIGLKNVVYSVLISH